MGVACCIGVAGESSPLGLSYRPCDVTDAWRRRLRRSVFIPQKKGGQKGTPGRPGGVQLYCDLLYFGHLGVSGTLLGRSGGVCGFVRIYV